jgi:hypothetical protein
VTKRIHKHLYGDRGNGGFLGTEARVAYENWLQDNPHSLLGLIRPREVVILHDSHPLGPCEFAASELLHPGEPARRYAPGS